MERSGGNTFPGNVSDIADFLIQSRIFLEPRISNIRGSEHWRFTFSLPRECALARTRAKVGPWRAVEGVTALLRRNGLAEQAGEEVGSPPKKQAQGSSLHGARKQAQGSRLHGAHSGAP